MDGHPEFTAEKAAAELADSSSTWVQLRLYEQGTLRPKPKASLGAQASNDRFTFVYILIA